MSLKISNKNILKSSLLSLKNQFFYKEKLKSNKKFKKLKKLKKIKNLKDLQNLNKLQIFKKN